MKKDPDRAAKFAFAALFHDLLCLASYRETSVILVSFDRNGCA